MAQIADPSPSAAPSPKQLGRQLRDVRKQKGLSRSEVARSAGLTRRELAAYERGKVAVPESDLWCLAGSCGVDVGELLPNRDPLQISSELSSLTVGNSIRHLRATQERDGVLREYLSMIYELRNLPPGSRVPLREADLATLADALGGAPDMIEQRLMELIGASREEAARLRAMILPPLSLPAASGDHVARRLRAAPPDVRPRRRRRAVLLDAARRRPVRQAAVGRHARAGAAHRRVPRQRLRRPVHAHGPVREPRTRSVGGDRPVRAALG